MSSQCTISNNKNILLQLKVDPWSTTIIIYGEILCIPTVGNRKELVEIVAFNAYVHVLSDLCIMFMYLGSCTRVYSS